jgi:hypothetical protein
MVTACADTSAQAYLFRNVSIAPNRRRSLSVTAGNLARFWIFFAVGHAFAVPALLGLRHGNSDKGKRSERDGGHQGRNAHNV